MTYTLEVKVVGCYAAYFKMCPLHFLLLNTQFVLYSSSVMLSLFLDTKCTREAPVKTK